MFLNQIQCILVIVNPAISQEPITLWDYIKYLRENNNLTIAEFAKQIGTGYFHATTIERDFNVVKRTASSELLKQIAKVCSRNEKDRKDVEHKLMMRRARIFFQKEVLDMTLLGIKAESFIVTESMPKAFIDRVRTDIQALPDTGIIDRLSITRFAVDSMLSGKYYLTKKKVIELAKRFGQSEQDYLSLAGYMPDSFQKLLANPYFSAFLSRTDALSESDLNKCGSVLETLLNIFISDKKKEG